LTLIPALKCWANLNRPLAAKSKAPSRAPREMLALGCFKRRLAAIAIEHHAAACQVLTLKA